MSVDNADVTKQDLTALQNEMRGCQKCFTEGYDIVPGAVFRGKATAKVLLIGQAPGITEVEAKRPFNASSGRRLFQWLGAAGWEEADFRTRHYMTAVTKCYPGRNTSGKGDRVPSKEEQALCRPFLDREMALVNPHLIIPVGGLAIKLFYPKSAKLKEIIGTAAYFPPDVLANPVNYNLKQAERLTEFEADRNPAGRWLIPLPHPSGASLWPNRPENKALINRAIELLNAIRTAWHL